MWNGKCNGCRCTTMMIVKILLIVGGLNWGLIGVAMLMGNGSNWNVVNLLLGGWPMVEAIVFVLVGIAAIMKIFGCRCRKCMAGCASCDAGNMDKKM